MKTKYLLSILCFSLLACQDEKIQSTPETVVASEFLEPGIMCGTVQFEDGCSPQLDSIIQFGLALVHHMTYDDAEYNFDKVIEMDPDCFWGHWGKALCYIHPLWPDQPSNDRLNKGLSLVNKAMALAEKEKEQYYGKALANYYHNGLMKSEAERLIAFEDGWKKVTELYPEDIEARLFYGLSRLSTASPSDKNYAVQREVGQMAESTLEVIPDHPGGFHYAIHAYDYPPLAPEAVRVAKNYSSIAPEIPHALHMPTHIFTRLGYWDESIDGNLKSAEAAKRMPVNGQISLHYLHALDYLVYAYLQQSRNDAAQKIYKEIVALEPPFQKHGAVAYAMAAIPARIALENQNWKLASEIELPHKTGFSWEAFPQFQAINYFAKGIGAAKLGDIPMAEKAYNSLDSLFNSMEKAPQNKYWKKQIEIQKTAVRAWIVYANGDRLEGMRIMNTAAELEDTTTKSPITPGELLPMREMLGDLYLEQGNAQMAISNYKRSLERNPNRFNTLYGAGKAAEMMEDGKEASSYFEALMTLVGENDSERSQIEYARQFLKGHNEVI